MINLFKELNAHYNDINPFEPYFKYEQKFIKNPSVISRSIIPKDSSFLLCNHYYPCLVSYDNIDFVSVLISIHNYISNLKSSIFIKGVLRNVTTFDFLIKVNQKRYYNSQPVTVKFWANDVDNDVSAFIKTTKNLNMPEGLHSLYKQLQVVFDPYDLIFLR